MFLRNRIWPWFVLALLGTSFVLILLYSWQVSPARPVSRPAPERGPTAEPALDQAGAKKQSGSPDPVAVAAERGVVTGEIRIPPTTSAKGSSGIFMSIISGGRILALAAVEPGSFRLEYSRPDPDVGIGLRASGYGWVSVSRRLTRPVQDVGILRMIPGLCYGGIALDASGNPVEGVRIHFYSQNGLQGESAPTMSDGRFSIGVDSSLLGARLDESLGRYCSLLPLEQGVAYQRVPCEPSGYSGEHELRLVRRRRMVLRITDGETGRPAGGARCTISRRFGRSLPELESICTTHADEDGLAPISWSPAMGPGYLSIRIDRRTFTGFLWKNLPDDKGEPVDVLLPGEERVSVLKLRCILGAEDAPVAKVMVRVLGKHDGRLVAPFLSGSTDASGELTWSFAEVAGVGPTSCKFISWTTCFIEESGRPKLTDSDGHVDWRSGQPIPYTIRLEEPGHQSPHQYAGSFWFRCVEEGTGRELTPRFLKGGIVDGNGSKSLERMGLSRSPVLLADGTRVWRANGAGLPDHTRNARAVQLGITVEGRMPFPVEIPVIDYLEALDHGSPLVFELPRLPDHRRTVQILSTAGKPVAGAIVSVHPHKSEGAALWFTRPRWLQSGADGRIDVSHLYDGCRYRIQTVDGVTGDGGVLPDYDPSSAEERVTLRLIQPRVLKFRVQHPDGLPVENLRAGLESTRHTLPSIAGKVSLEDSVVTFPPAVLELYSLGLRASARLTAPLKPLEVPPTWTLRLPADQVGGVVIAQPSTGQGR